MKTVLVFGTFDVIHPGHEYFLKKAHTYGEKLTAVVARDEFVLKMKKKKPVHTERERMQHILSSGLAETALLADEITGQFSVVEKASPQIVCFGHDQIPLKEAFDRWLTSSSLKIEEVVIDAWKRDRYSSTLRNKKYY